MSDFNTDFEQSEKDSHNPIFSQIYKQLFGNNVEVTYVKDRTLQLRGVDREVKVNGWTFRMEEKMRKTTYKDVLLELSTTRNTGNSNKGWIYKEDNLTDYFIYVIPYHNLCYVIKWQDLLSAFKQNESEWISQYTIRPSYNDDGTTYNIAVPVHVLRDYMKVMEVRVGLYQ